MEQIEIEKIYLIKELPDLSNIKMIDIKAGHFYDPNSIDSLRVRQKGEKFELLKKEGENSEDRIEHVIDIKKEEFDILWKSSPFRYQKRRYFYPLGNNLIGEIDIYNGKLKGYARVEVEFEDNKELNNFIPPDWFGSEITKWNQTIHKDIFKISFDDMKKRFKEKGIELKKIIL